MQVEFKESMSQDAMSNSVSSLHTSDRNMELPKKSKEEKVNFYKTEKRILLLYSVNNFCVSGTQICAIFKVVENQPIEFGLNPLAWAHETPLLKSLNNGFPR